MAVNATCMKGILSFEAIIAGPGKGEGECKALVGALEGTGIGTLHGRTYVGGSLILLLSIENKRVWFYFGLKCPRRESLRLLR